MMAGQHQAVGLDFEKARLPVLPTGVVELIRALNDDNMSSAALAAFIERFPSIVARLVFLANSAWSSPVEPISSLEMACGRLGFNVVRSVSVALAISTPFNPARCTTFLKEVFWTRALLVADVASWLSQEIGGSEVGSGRMAGVLHNIGLLWLAEYRPEETDRALRRTQGGQESGVNNALIEECGLGYAEAGAMLGEAWGFPRFLVDGIRYQMAPDEAETCSELARILFVARTMAAEAMRGNPFDPEQYPTEMLQKDEKKLQEIYSRLEKAWPGTRKLAEVLFA